MYRSLSVVNIIISFSFSACLIVTQHDHGKKETREVPPPHLQLLQMNHLQHTYLVLTLALAREKHQQILGGKKRRQNQALPRGPISRVGWHGPEKRLLLPKSIQMNRKGLPGQA